MNSLKIIESGLDNHYYIEYGYEKFQIGFLRKELYFPDDPDGESGWLIYQHMNGFNHHLNKSGVFKLIDGLQTSYEYYKDWLYATKEDAISALEKYLGFTPKCTCDIHLLMRAGCQCKNV